MLRISRTLVEFALVCCTNRLRLDFDATSLIQNESHKLSRSTICQIYENTNIELFENFLRTFPIHTLSFASISPHHERSLERLARAVDNNETLEILELKDLNCSAIFHRKEQTPDTENNAADFAPVQIIKYSSRSKLETFLGLFSCHRAKRRRHSHEEIVLQPVVPTQRDNSKSVSSEPFYTLCNYPILYKQMQEIAQNFKLEKPHISIDAHVQMSNVVSSIKSNLTVTKLRINRRIVTVKDIEMLGEALRNNTTITHLNLNEINISIMQFRQIFDVLRDTQTLGVLEVNHCIPHSDRRLFTQEVKQLELDNPFLKVVYENQ